MKWLILLLFAFSACTLDPNKLAGSWQASAYFENGQTLTTPLDSVRISFSPSGDYDFHSIGYYQENGRYRLSGNFLFLSDTTMKNPNERTIKVDYLSADSLKLGMQSNGKNQAVFFAKIR